MPRKNDSRLNFIVGLFVICLSILLVVSLFIIGQGKGAWKEKVNIVADFRSISGLKKGSPVQIEGIQIGVVTNRKFIQEKYPCNPATEDNGRFVGDRTDDCDPTMFCAPEGLCAELEPYSANIDLHPACEENQQCGEQEVCVTQTFHRRYRRVLWTGGTGVCASYTTLHKRIRVEMKVFAESLEHIRRDSRATVSQNGLLGDQLVQISAGQGEPVAPGGRIQTDPSLIENILAVRDRADATFVKVEETIAGVAELAQAMGNEATVRNIQGLIANIHEISGQVAKGDGLVGALLNDKEYVEDFGATLRSIRDTALNIERFVARANSSLKKIDENLQPIVDDGRRAIADISKAITDFRDPANKSVAAKLLYDQQGQMLADLEQTLENLEQIVATIEKGEGTAGKLLKDPKAYDDLVKLLGNIERNNTLKRLVRWAMEEDEAASSAAPALEVD